MRASATPGPGSVPYLAGAYQIFEAPPGASLESVTFDVAVIRLASHWTTAIMGYDNDFNFEDLPYGCHLTVGDFLYDPAHKKWLRLFLW